MQSGPGEVQNVIIPFQIYRMEAEFLSAEVGFGQSGILDGRSHGSIQNENAFLDFFFYHKWYVSVWLVTD